MALSRRVDRKFRLLAATCGSTLTNKVQLPTIFKIGRVHRPYVHKVFVCCCVPVCTLGVIKTRLCLYRYLRYRYDTRMLHVDSGIGRLRVWDMVCRSSQGVESNESINCDDDSRFIMDYPRSKLTMRFRRSIRFDTPAPAGTLNGKGRSPRLPVQ